MQMREGKLLVAAFGGTKRIAIDGLLDHGPARHGGLFKSRTTPERPHNTSFLEFLLEFLQCLIDRFVFFDGYNDHLTGFLLRDCKINK